MLKQNFNLRHTGVRSIGPDISGKKLMVLFVLLFITTSAFAQHSWQWATKAGGSSIDAGYGITIDNYRNIYVTGFFDGTAIFGSYSLTSDGYDDIFIAKMDANGNWQWATRAGGSDYDIGYGITIDNYRNTYVTGSIRGTAIFGSYSLTSDGYNDIFVAKMDANGNWQWATKAGGSCNEIGYGITIDDAGNIYVTGFFDGTATFDSYSITSNGHSDIFVAKMDSNGNWQWVTKAGGSSWDEGLGITFDAAGKIYVTGSFREIATFGSHSLTSIGNSDIFVANLDILNGVNNDFTQRNNFIKQNSPNPFDINTSISYFIPHNCKVEMRIYNIKGEFVTTIVDEYKQSGEYIIDFNCSELGSGIYFIKMRARKDVDVIKMVKIK